MATVIEVTESKIDCLAECAEKVLKHAGKLMSAVEELSESKSYGFRGGRMVRKDSREFDHEYEKRYGKEGMEGYNRYY